MTSLIHHFLRESVVKSAEKEAVVHGEERISYGDLERLTSQLANGLRSNNIRRGDRVGIFLDRTVYEVLSIYGIFKAGGVIVPINQLLFPPQVQHIINDCKVRGLITSRAKLGKIADILKESPSIEFVATVDESPGNLAPVKTFSLQEILGSAADSPPVDEGISNDLAAILYTSGSTGKPKGVMLSHANLIAGSRIVSTYLDIGESDRILSVLPFSFDYGLNQLLTAVQHGGTTVILGFRFPDEIVQALLKERITGLAGVPPLWSFLAQPSSSLHKNKFPYLRYITNSGGAMPLPVLASLRKALTSTKVYLMYGLTEAFRSTYLPPEEVDRRPTSMGKAIPDTEILVLNEEGQLCNPNEVGELVHRGPTVSLGYWGLPEVTAKVLRPNPLLPPELQHSGERVCYSGDIVKMDDEGFLYFVGRRDSTIKSSGYRISPTEVEEVLFASGRLREAAVIGIPDSVLGQSIKAFVVPLDGNRIDEAEMKAFCAARMPRYMIPRNVEVLAELPKTGSGKIDYPSLHRREKDAKPSV
jgi:acyl-CoA ligase (AMP-forming) (exosortase A-associated)